MKLIIAGSRTWSPSLAQINLATTKVANFDNFGYNLAGYGGRGDLEVVCGMAPGADMAGLAWAKRWGFPVKQMPADWERLGKRAGPMRNRAMAEYADAALVFWDGKSSGSTNMHAWMSVFNKPSQVFIPEQLDV